MKKKVQQKKFLISNYLLFSLLAFALFFIPINTMAQSNETTIDLSKANSGARYSLWSCSGSTYTITGNVTIIGNVYNVGTSSRITLNIASGVTADWKAIFESSTSFSSATTYHLVSMPGDGTLSISNGYIHNQGNGRTISATGAGASIIVCGGIVQGKSASAIYTTGINSTVTVSGGSVMNAGKTTTSATINMYNTSNNAKNVIVTGSGSVYADGTSSDVAIRTNGNVEISGNAKVRAFGGRAIHALGAGSKVTVSENSQVWSDKGVAIHTTGSNANVIVEGGSVYNEATDANTHPVIYMNGGGNVTVEDTGKVEARAAGGYAICYASSTIGNVYIKNNAQVSATTGRAINVTGTTAAGPHVEVSGGRVSTTTGNAIHATTTNATITVSGGTVSATTGYAINASGSVSVSGGFVFAHGTAILGSGNVISNNAYKLNNPSGTGVVVAWNRTGTGPWTYPEEAITALVISPNGTATWHNDAALGGGISYVNGANTGFFPIDATVTANYGLIFKVVDGKFYRDLDGYGTLDNVYDPGSAAVWDNNTKILTLQSNFTWSTSAPAALTVVGGNLTMNLEGNNKFESTFSGSTTSYGILFSNDVTITGNGSLTSIGSAATTESYGISATGDITVSGGTITTLGSTQAIRSSLFSVIKDNYTYWTGNNADSATQFSYPGSAFTNTTPTKYVKIQGNIFTWNGGTNNDWDTPGNWTPSKIPGSFDIVVISGNATNFPILTKNTSAAEIHFEPGAQIGNQHYLTGKAFVQYDLSKRNRWLMLSIPLQEAYPGDFTFGGYPQTWVRNFKVSNNGSTTAGTWETARSSKDAFSAGDGFVLWLNADNEANYPTDANKGLKLLKNIRELPFFQNHAAGSSGQSWYKQIHQAHEYEGTQSTFYKVKLINNNTEYERDNSTSYKVGRSDDAYRLAGGSVLKTLNFGKNDEAGGGDVALVGNPYMAALDFDKLYEENIDTDDGTEIIKPSYQVWTGSSGYGVYTCSGYAGPLLSKGNLNNYIAPLQAFIVEKPSPSASDPLLFKESMTTVNPVTLRSSASNKNKIDIVARNPVAGILTFIAKREGGQEEFGNLDARKIISGISDVPEVYTLKPCNGGSIATAVNIIKNDEGLIPIGLATSYTGNITLSFSGMDTYDAYLSLIDAETKIEVDLTSLSSYDYVVNYTPEKINGNPAVCENRFFIRISKSHTALREISTEKADVFETGGIIQVISSASNPIKEVAVYNLQGMLIYKATAINAIAHTANRNWSKGVYIVKVISEKSIDNFKLIVK